MNSNNPRDWNVLDNKRRAIIAVLQHVISQPADVGNRCVEDDKYVRQLFQDPNIGNIDIPKDVKTVFMPTGELARKAKGSVVIELPPRQGDGSGTAPPNPNDLLKFVLCCYNVWATAA
jgi:hypothetical protein